MLSDFKISTFSVTKRSRSIKACEGCKKSHKKCFTDLGASSCNLCKLRSLKCVWNTVEDDLTRTNSTKRKKSEPNKEHTYEMIVQNYNQMKPQFVCATQPLALLISRDSFLCFDGDDFGLFYPWRGIDSDEFVEKNIDEDFRSFLNDKGAFIVPQMQEQRRLLQIFLDNVYPLYPVVERNILKDIKAIPIMLLNAILLSAIRFDASKDIKYIRNRSNQFYERCKLLELMETNKVTLIQSYLLLSIHEEGMGGASSSKKYITKACNLCGELRITIIGGSNGLASNQENTEISSNTSIHCRKRMLIRLFWVSFCCDRLVSATSGREMFYNPADLMIDTVKLRDFDEGGNQDSDFAIFMSWYEICQLIDRIQCSLYRPPHNRTVVDHNLENDLLNWSIENESHMKEIFRNSLKIYHAYAFILYLRCKVDSISFIVGGFEPKNTRNEISGGHISLIHRYSSLIIELIESNKFIHHVFIVHAVLHVISLLQLESKMNMENNQGTYCNIMMGRSIKILRNFKDYWWFAGAALRLCSVVIPPEFFKYET